MYHILWLLIGTAVIEATANSDTYCHVSISLRNGGPSKPQPLILTDTENPTFLRPSKKELLIIPTNTSILLACPGNNNSFDNFGPAPYLRASCIRGNQFSVSSSVYSFSTFKCKRLPQESERKTSEFCLGVHQQYEIGFEIENYFLKLMEFCRDEISYRTYYSKHILIKEIGYKQQNYNKPQWRSGAHYPGISVNKLYTYKSQLQQVGIQLGSVELAQKYIYYKKKPINQWQAFNRGHLTPKADFVYGAQQSATFWLLNANPQSVSFNSGNWMYLENSVRKLASTRHVDLIVHTGVHGITSLKDLKANEQALYLQASKTGKILPIPRFFWKIIHDPISNRATAFIGVNQVHADKITDDMYLCSDITDNYDFSWLAWQPKNITLGVSYVCTVESLRDAVPSVPDIGNTDVLV